MKLTIEAERGESLDGQLVRLRALVHMAAAIVDDKAGVFGSGRETREDVAELHGAAILLREIANGLDDLSGEFTPSTIVGEREKQPQGALS